MVNEHSQVKTIKYKKTRNNCFKCENNNTKLYNGKIGKNELR